MRTGPDHRPFGFDPGFAPAPGIAPGTILGIAGALGFALLLNGCSLLSESPLEKPAVSPTQFTTTHPAPGSAPQTGAGEQGQGPREIANPKSQIPNPPTPGTSPGISASSSGTSASSPADVPSHLPVAVEGMVGQVNGQAIYAATVLDPVEEQLKRLGQTLNPLAFRMEARRLVTARLDEIVFNRLILGEAERDLSENEQRGLQFMLKERREELIRRWGAGSLTAAELTLREKEGKTLDDKLEEMRQQLIVQRYLTSKLLPKINITRKDIERYYNDHPELYKPKPGRTVRLIRAANPQAATDIAAQLTGGTPFITVAASKLNSYHAEEAGLFAKNVTGEQIIGIKPLNDAVLSLKAGQYSAQIEANGAQYWIYLESESSGEEKPLREVQAEIERTLREQAYRQLMTRYRDQLFAKGSYNPLDQMVQALTDIAVARYTKAD